MLCRYDNSVWRSLHNSQFSNHKREFVYSQAKGTYTNFYQIHTQGKQSSELLIHYEVDLVAFGHSCNILWTIVLCRIIRTISTTQLYLQNGFKSMSVALPYKVPHLPTESTNVAEIKCIDSLLLSFSNSSSATLRDCCVTRWFATSSWNYAITHSEIENGAV